MLSNRDIPTRAIAQSLKDWMQNTDAPEEPPQEPLKEAIARLEELDWKLLSARKKIVEMEGKAELVNPRKARASIRYNRLCQAMAIAAAEFDEDHPIHDAIIGALDELWFYLYDHKSHPAEPPFDGDGYNGELEVIALVQSERNSGQAGAGSE